MQPDIKRGLVLGILVLAVIIVLWSQFREGDSRSLSFAEATDPLPDGRVVPEIVAPSPLGWEKQDAPTIIQESADSGEERVSPEVVQSDPPPAPDPSTPLPKPSAAAGNRYHVFSEKDRTLWHLAEKYYGDGNKWRVIYGANKSIIADPDVPPLGARLVIPPIEPVTTVTPPGGEQKASPRTHTVVAGETLSSIAKKYYSDSTRWKIIFNANKKTIPSPEKLAVGMVLVIPPGE